MEEEDYYYPYSSSLGASINPRPPYFSSKRNDEGLMEVDSSSVRASVNPRPPYVCLFILPRYSL